jgi:hypothetical protein
MKLIKGFLFYILLYSRGVFLKIGRFLGGMMFIVALFAFFIVEKKLDGIGFLFVSFGIFLINELYDNILINLNPTGNELTLIK